MTDSSHDSQPAATGSATFIQEKICRVLPALTLFLSLAAFAWPTITSGFGYIQGGLGDSRLVNFTLEHSYRWLMNMPLAEDLWSPPIFFPARNVATYTDLLLGVAPLYWPWRWLGFEPHTAYQCWMLSCWSLNFMTFFLLLRRGFRVSTIGSCLGAHLFAFASPRYMSMAHQQLVPQFWLILSIAGLIMLFRNAQERESPARKWLASVMFWGGLVAQLYTAVYPLAFFCVALGAAGLFAILSPSLSRVTRRTARKTVFPILATGVVAVVLAFPIVAGYHATTRSTVMPYQDQDQIHLPKALSWLFPGRTNLVYGRFQRAIDVTEYDGLSQSNGIGVVTLIAAAFGLWLGRHRRAVQLVVAGYAGLTIITVTFPGGWSPWWVVLVVVPGSAALDAVARAGQMVLFPASVGVAITLAHLEGRRRWIVAAVIAAFVVVEQPHRRHGFDKESTIARVESIASRIPPGSTSFLLASRGPSWDRYLHDDAAWAALAAGVPTVNGRYGNFPLKYPFRRPMLDRRGGETHLRAALYAWLSRHGGEPETASLVAVAPRPPRRKRRAASSIDDAKWKAAEKLRTDSIDAAPAVD